MILCSTGSKCSSFNKGVTWSCLRAPKISRAAQFWANCSLWTKCFGRLQLSNLHVTKACTHALVLLPDKNFLIRDIPAFWLDYKLPTTKIIELATQELFRLMQFLQLSHDFLYQLSVSCELGKIHLTGIVRALSMCWDVHRTILQASKTRDPT